MKDHSECHAEVTASLRQEQQGLCCYCEMELKDVACHIEHMEPQSLNNTRRYDYGNLAMSCTSRTSDHCGAYKEHPKNKSGYAYDPNRFTPPQHPATSDLFSYLSDGSVIAADQVDPARFAYMRDYVGLDCASLRQRRREHARDLIDTLGSEPEDETLDWMLTEYLKPNADGHLIQFHSLSRAILEP
ncbi:MAG: retron system putative HNH endonuclease [Pseudomonadota bacterium]|nr:retron system putative HNH endonuclease [Pseudomonadota bacterium]